MGLHAHVYGNFAENVKDGEMNFNRKHMTKCNEDIISEELMLQTDSNTSPLNMKLV